jgi:hypothetical protein
MPHFCATKFFSLITNRLFSMALPERASGLSLCRRTRFDLQRLLNPFGNRVSKLLKERASACCVEVFTKLEISKYGMGAQSVCLFCESLPWSVVVQTGKYRRTSSTTPDRGLPPTYFSHKASDPTTEKMKKAA